MSTGSLIVKIGADLNDFNTKFDQMTKTVQKAADKLSDVGEKMTKSITVPFVLASAALFKFGADVEDTSLRFGRVFGDAADQMKADLEGLAKTTPVTVTQMESLANSLDNVIKALGIAPSGAVKMSESMMKLAADVAAFNHTDFGETLDQLQRGLEGRTRGLINLGIVITKTDIQQEAYKEHLLGENRVLTDAGTALVMYNLIMEKTGLMQGEAARTADQNSKSWQFLKRDAEALAQHAGTVLLPILADIVHTLDDMVQMFNKVPPGMIKAIFYLGGFAAIVGPTVFLVTKFIGAIQALGAAFTLLTEGGAVIGFLGAIATPIGWVVAGVTALVVALTALWSWWNRFKDGATSGPMQQSDAPGKIIGKVTMTDVTKGGSSNKLTPADVGNVPLSEDKRTPLEQFKDAADAITKGFDSALAHGQPLKPFLAEIASLHQRANNFLHEQGGLFDKSAQEAQKVLDQIQQITNTLALVNAKTPEDQQKILIRIARDQKTHFDAVGTAASELAAATMKQAQDLEVRFAKIQMPQLDTTHFEAVVKSLENIRANDNALKLREELIRLPDGFDAARIATLEFREGLRKYKEDLDKRFLASETPVPFNAGLEAATAYNEKRTATQNNYAFREAMLRTEGPGLSPGFDAARQAAIEYAEAQKATTETIQLEYEHLKLTLNSFGIHLGNLSTNMQLAVNTIASAAVNFAQSLVATAGGSGKGAGIGRGLGGLGGTVLGAIVGGPVGAMVGGVIGEGIGGLFGGLFDHHKKSVEAAANSVDTMTKNVNNVNDALSNLPANLNLAFYRYLAAPVLTIPSAPPPSSSTPPSGVPMPGGTTGPYTPIPGYSNPTLVIQGNLIVQGVQKPIDLANEAMKQAATGGPRFVVTQGSNF